MSDDVETLPARKLAEVRRLLALHEKKSKASVSLAGELLRAADVVAGPAERSALIERALRRYFRALIRRSRREHDLAAINAAADRTNQDSDALLDVQAWPE